MSNVKNSRIITVEQECWKSISDFNKKPNYRKGVGPQGVYIWGFKTNKENHVPRKCDDFFPYYVGRSLGTDKCMYTRTFEHLSYLKGGNYSIFDIDEFNSTYPDRFKNSKGEGIGVVQNEYQKESKSNKKANLAARALPDNKYSGMLHFPEGVHIYSNFMTNKKIKNQVDRMLNDFCITFFKPISSDNLLSDIIELEKFFGNLIGYDHLITRKYDKNPSIKVEIKNKIKGQKNILVENLCDIFKNCQ